jgi:hypothetical protein
MPHRDLDIPEYTDTVHAPTITHVCAPEPGLVMYKIYSRYWFFEPTMEHWARTTRVLTKRLKTFAQTLGVGSVRKHTDDPL